MGSAVVLVGLRGHRQKRELLPLVEKPWFQIPVGSSS